ncbi:tyrosine-protein phosphatase [Candidatus Nitrosacidococcus tergens]|uniref:protein-tyrosine-phosphatase n=1 Tax=Candidatus Nitrosacidococcus tergens TaxID=553981 RepID=A0A7G1Q994_9GAMM|nr:CpsB/CapC family capsule biosynthesis tyrosine phosphatase [Candidatus Nitrosacidococcus tergens]CAB1275783.1 Protein-tyrosine-phosphatase [Candidatus Nitrosacidococcus tergens]
MIDLHCHILPEIDDGASDLETALAMARVATGDGITITACTPHIYPGLYDNTVEGIKEAIEKLQQQLIVAGIELKLVLGADIQITPDLRQKLQDKKVPTLNESRYFLFEPPHHVHPPGFADLAFNVATHGYVPVITHPERLTWIGDHYSVFKDLALKGSWIQITAGSLTGRFGRSAQYWGEKMLDDGLVHILATDSHGVKKRPPLLGEGMLAAEKWVGDQEARYLVEDRPQAILNNQSPDSIPKIPALLGRSSTKIKKKGLFSWLSSG